MTAWAYGVPRTHTFGFGCSPSKTNKVLIRWLNTVLCLIIVCHRMVSANSLTDPKLLKLSPGLSSVAGLKHHDSLLHGVQAKIPSINQDSRTSKTRLRRVLATQSALNGSLLDELRQSLSSVSLRLDAVLTVDRSNLHSSSPRVRAELEARIQETISQRAFLARMQATMRELDGLPQTCSHHFFSRLQDEFLVIRPLSISTGSMLRAGHTVSFAFDHLSLINAQLSLPSADDLRVYYQRSLDEEPVELHRTIEGIASAEATLHFPIVEQVNSDSVLNNRYALVFGNPSAGPALCDPRQVFLLYEDFTVATHFSQDWETQRGTWTVQNGYLDGLTILSDKDASGGMELEVGAYFLGGFDWTDVEVQLDMQVGESATGPGPIVGPFLRTDRANLTKTTAAFAEYTGVRGSRDMMFCSLQRDVVEEFSEHVLPTDFEPYVWHRIWHVVLGNRLTQWFDGQSTEPQVSLDSLARSGTLGLGCRVTATNPVCSAMFDNIQVRSVVEREPVLTLPSLPCTAEREIKATLGAFASTAADSCKQIYDLSFQDGILVSPNAKYFIKTPSGPVETYCDMANGGWTLAAQIGGNVGDISSFSFLRSNINTDSLQTPTIATGVAASLDAVGLAVNHATEILLSNGNRASGIGSEWVRWPLPRGRDEATLWNRAMGAAAVAAGNLMEVTIMNQRGQSQICLQNRFGISSPHGAVPATVRASNGFAAAGDLCMAVGVSPASVSPDAAGFTAPLRGYDAPSSDTDWPNSNTGQAQIVLSVWLR